VRRGRPRGTLAEPQCDLVALAEVAGIEAVAEVDLLGSHTCSAEHADAFGAQFAEQRIAVGRGDCGERAHHAAGEIDAHRGDERAERGEHAGVGGEHDAGGFQQLGHAAGVDGSRTTEREHGHAA